jgi:DNA mismatch endonuclease, patch repair protein
MHICAISSVLCIAGLRGCKGKTGGVFARGRRLCFKRISAMPHRRKKRRQADGGISKRSAQMGGHEFPGCFAPAHGMRMADTLTPSERSKRMALVHSKNTCPEWIVRRLVHRMGHRYRLHVKELPGCPDLVFRRARKVIFVHGCFWHRHADPSCNLARLPKSRLDFWAKKLDENRRRDERNVCALSTAGWDVMVVWECELRHKEQLENRLKRFLQGWVCEPSSFLLELEVLASE